VLPIGWNCPIFRVFFGLQEVVRNHVDGASFVTRRKEEEIIQELVWSLVVCMH
jgi:hypothetical protein